MSREVTDTCAGCRKFPLHTAAKNGGRALCEDFEREQAWSDRACVLHMPASDRRERANLVKQLRAQQLNGEK